MLRIVFARTHKNGLKGSQIFVDGSQLKFSNHRCVRWLEPGAHEIAWRILGPPGSSLVVTRTVEEIEKTIVDDAVEHGAGESDSTDFTI